MELNKKQSQTSQEASPRNCKVTRKEGAALRSPKATGIQGSLYFGAPPPGLSVCQPHGEPRGRADGLCVGQAGAGLALW